MNCQYIIASKLIVTIYGYSVLFTVLKGELITPCLIFFLKHMLAQFGILAAVGGQGECLPATNSRPQG